jgi:tripartite-type tricarboxylate transporter receptor subunit TctC
VKKFIKLFGLAILILSLAGCGNSQAASAPAAGGQNNAYPNKPIQVIVGYSAGSGTDMHIRTIAPYLEKELGVPIVVVNKAGASGILACTEVAKAVPDGYTLGVLNLPAIPASAATTQLEFDPVNGLTFIGNFSADAVTIMVKGDGPYKTLQDLINAAKKKPGSVKIGITGKTSQDYLTSLGIAKAAGVEFSYVSFEGNAEGISAVLGGHIDAMAGVISTFSSYQASGQGRMLGFGSDKRIPEYPDIPTFKEQNIELFKGGDYNYKALGGPAGLPADVQKRLGDALKNATGNKEYQDKVKAMGAMALYKDSAELKSLMESLIPTVKDFVSQAK